LKKEIEINGFNELLFRTDRLAFATDKECLNEFLASSPNLKKIAKKK
jgi:hypothetical protein